MYFIEFKIKEFEKDCPELDTLILKGFELHDQSKRFVNREMVDLSELARFTQV